MLSTLSRRIVARGLRPSALALHRVRMCQSAAAQPEVKVTIEGAAAASSDEETAEVALEKALRPKEIVEQLDRYIIGQPEAKRAVAVAMRNRWRRQRVASPLKEEVCYRARSFAVPCPHASTRAPTARARAVFAQISPKNILMIGPTGKAVRLTRGPRSGHDRSPPPAGQARPKARPRPQARPQARPQGTAQGTAQPRACAISAVVSRFVRPAGWRGTLHRAQWPAPHAHPTRHAAQPHSRTPHGRTAARRGALRAQAAARRRLRAASPSSRRRPSSRRAPPGDVGRCREM